MDTFWQFISISTFSISPQLTFGVIWDWHGNKNDIFHLKRTHIQLGAYEPNVVHGCYCEISPQWLHLENFLDFSQVCLGPVRSSQSATVGIAQTRALAWTGWDVLRLIGLRCCELISYGIFYGWRRPCDPGILLRSLLEIIATKWLTDGHKGVGGLKGAPGSIEGILAPPLSRTRTCRPEEVMCS